MDVFCAAIFIVVDLGFLPFTLCSAFEPIDRFVVPLSPDTLLELLATFGVAMLKKLFIVFFSVVAQVIAFSLIGG